MNKCRENVVVNRRHFGVRQCRGTVTGPPLGRGTDPTMSVDRVCIGPGSHLPLWTPTPETFPTTPRSTSDTGEGPGLYRPVNAAQRPSPSYETRAVIGRNADLSRRIRTRSPWGPGSRLNGWAGRKRIPSPVCCVTDAKPVTRAGTS